MLTSMTGYGKGEAENSKGKIYIEIKSLNHKYFDMVSRLPQGFLIFEDRIKSSIQKAISRGRISLSLDYEDLTKKGGTAELDAAAARRYVKLLTGLRKSLGLSGDISLQQVISMPGVMTYAPTLQKKDIEALWPLIKRALDPAIKQLLVSKAQEGEMLKKQLRNISDKIERSLSAIKLCWAQQKKIYKGRLIDNIRFITGQDKIYNKEKLEEEAAAFIRNSDISEETCRIESHIKAFKKVLSDHDEVGRHMDFIAQEITREANTVGAKANNYRISKEIIKVKGLIEKIREQTQNVE